MSRKVAVAGLSQFSNYGDQFICKSVSYLTRQAGDWEPLQVPFLEDDKSDPMFWVLKSLDKLCRALPGEVLRRPFEALYLMLRRREKRYYGPLLEGCDALIFACGSYKYSTQNLWAAYAMLIECARERKIPVMFDAMNIQKFNEKDWRCLQLKKYTNDPAVKMITSRDGDPGVARLKADYLLSDRIAALPAGDPAYWIPEVYGVRKKASDVIGVNLIRPDTFTNYGGSLNREQVIKIFADLLQLLEAKKQPYLLFTNGLKKDEELLEEAAALLGRKPEEFPLQIPESDDQLARIVAGCCRVIGARLHSCICAYALDIPVTGLIWDEKLLHFAENAGLRDRFFTEEELSAEELLTALDLYGPDGYTAEQKARRELDKNRTKESIFAFLHECEW